MSAVSTTLRYRGLSRKMVHAQSFEVEWPHTDDVTTIEYSDSRLGVLFAHHYAKLKAIQTDRSLWVEDREPPSQTAVTLAFITLQQMEADLLKPTRVVASAEGGVAICFVEGDKYSDIEFFNNGTVLGVISNRRDRPHVWEIQQSSGDIPRALAKIRHFIEPSTSGTDDPKW